jgi:hypothetical protein
VPRTRSTALSSPADDLSTIDPSVLRETRQPAGRTEENDEEIKNDEEDQDSIDDEAVKLLFFSRANRPKGNICPFSHPPRENPCTTHNRSMSRKDVIEKHLKGIQNKGGDPQHPLDDPLWKSFEVRWFMLPAPTFDNSTKSTALAGAQSRYYQKRKLNQQRLEQDMHQKLQEGAIAEEEYKKVLIGDKRRKFITERDTEKRVKEAMKTEMESMKQEMEGRLCDERRLRNDIEMKLAELRGQSSSTPHSAQIAGLESARNDMDTTEATLETYKELMADQAANVVNLWADGEFLTTANATYMHYYGFTWPTDTSEASFYIFATLLAPKSMWDGQIRGDSNIRHMHQQLRNYIEAAKDDAATDEMINALDQVVATFSSCCDVVKDNEQRTASMTKDGAQQWLNEQDRLWDTAKAAFQRQFNLDSLPAIQHIRLIDEFADTWRAQKDAERMKLSAQAAANDLI